MRSNLPLERLDLQMEALRTNQRPRLGQIGSILIPANCCFRNLPFARLIRPSAAPTSTFAVLFVGARTSRASVDRAILRSNRIRLCMLQRNRHLFVLIRSGNFQPASSTPFHG